jgi:uncharacterized membrane protein
MGFINRVINAVLHIHPWHSIIVHFPVALTAVGLFFIALALWRRSERWERFASVNMVLVAISTPVAGLAGLRDYFVRFGGQMQYVNVKIFLASSLLILASVTAVARYRKPDLLWRPSSRIHYLAAYVGAFLLAWVLGFIGGVIVYGF